MPKKYNIVFNSRKGTQPNGNKGDTNYTFDFGILPEGEYEASFTYMGQENDLSISASHNYKIAEVYIDIGKSNDYQAGNNSGTIRYSSSNFMGFLDTNRNTNYAYLYAKKKDNNEVFINRPTNNVVNIKILDNLGALYTDSGGVDLNHYVLVLHLELVREYHNTITKTMIEDKEEYEEVEVEEEESYEIPNIFVSS